MSETLLNKVNSICIVLLLTLIQNLMLSYSLQCPTDV